MALRGSSSRRGTSSPLTSVLRDLDRRTRAAESSRGRVGPAGPPGRDGVEGPAGPAPAAAVVVTGKDGRATWAFPPLRAVPVVGALVHDRSPDGSTTLTVVLEDVTPAGVTVRVWRTRALLGLGLLPAVPAGEGIAVHLTATPLPS